MTEAIAKEHLPGKVNVGGKSIELRNTTNLNFKNRSVGVIGATGTGKTTVIAALLKKLNFSLVLLITGDPNENGDLGLHLPCGLILDIGHIPKSFFERLCRFQTSCTKIFYCTIKSRSFKALVTVLTDENQEYRIEYERLHKEGDKKWHAP